MNSKEIVRFSTSSIEKRKEILKIPYSSARDKGKGKRIELWINIEMLARLLELKERNEVDEVKSEHKYPLLEMGEKKGCDLWWKKDNHQHWLEVKTIVLHSKSDGLKKKYKGRIDKDLKRIVRLMPPYTFHHLLLIFDDKFYNTGEWMKDVYTIYQKHDMKKEDKWEIYINQRQTLHAFLHIQDKEK